MFFHSIHASCCLGGTGAVMLLIIGNLVSFVFLEEVILR
jgi:hypothetical protein